MKLAYAASTFRRWKSDEGQIVHIAAPEGTWNLGFGTSGAAGRNSKVQYARSIHIVGLTTNWSQTTSNEEF